METTTDPYALAKAGMVHYTGDADPLAYDGAWYSSDDWVSDGYANCVRVSCMPEGPEGGRHIIIELLTILGGDSQSDRKRTADALKCCGQPLENALNPLCQIESCLAYGACDPNDGNPYIAQSMGFIIPDADEFDLAEFARYARIHGAEIVDDESKVWAVLSDLVGVHSCNP